MPVTTILDVQFKPDAVEEGLAVFRRILVDTRAFAGCESVTVVEDTADPTHFCLVEQWESLEADTAYRAWRAGEGKITDLAPTLAGAPRATIGTRRTDV